MTQKWKITELKLKIELTLNFGVGCLFNAIKIFWWVWGCYHHYIFNRLYFSTGVWDNKVDGQLKKWQYFYCGFDRDTRLVGEFRASTRHSSLLWYDNVLIYKYTVMGTEQTQDMNH